MANSWHRTGTVSVTNGSYDVVGSGTEFTGNVNPGDMFCGPDGNFYEVSTVVDNLNITVKQKTGTGAYLGPTLSAQSYAIIKTGPNNATVATQLTTLAVNWDQDRRQYNDWLAGDASTTPEGGTLAGYYPLTNSIGATSYYACPAKLVAIAATGLLTGYTSGAGTVAATDTILEAIQKLNGNDATKSPIAGPGSSQAFSVGALTTHMATNVNLQTLTGNTASKARLIALNDAANATVGMELQATDIHLLINAATGLHVAASTGAVTIDSTLSCGALTATGAVITTASTTNLKIAATGGTYRAYQTFATTVDKWDVGVNVNEANDAYQMRYEGGATAFAILPAGNVLIGTATASTGAKLEVAGSGSFTGVISTAVGFQSITPNGTNPVLNLRHTGVSDWYVEADATGALKFTGAAAERMSVSSAGLAVTGAISASTTLTAAYWTSTIAGSSITNIINAGTSYNTNIDFQENSVSKCVIGYVPSISAFRFGMGGSDILKVSSTGLAVTGGIKATSNLQFDCFVAPTLTLDYEVGFVATGDTTMQVKMRGSDGVVRACTLTFA